MDGFTCTSESKDISINYMLSGVKQDDVPVLYQINGLRKIFAYCNYFRLDSKDYTIFPNEKEVLLRIGLKFKIIDISEKIH